jgi:hypothetical protein
MANLKGIFKAAIAGATMIGGAVLGLEAKKCFTKPGATEDEFDDELCEETTDATEDPAEEAEEDEPAEAED